MPSGICSETRKGGTSKEAWLPGSCRRTWPVACRAGKGRKGSDLTPPSITWGAGTPPPGSTKPWQGRWLLLGEGHHMEKKCPEVRKMMVPKCAVGLPFPWTDSQGRAGVGWSGTRRWGGLWSGWGAASGCWTSLARVRLHLSPGTEVGNTIDKVGRHFFPLKNKFSRQTHV